MNTSTQIPEPVTQATQATCTRAGQPERFPSQIKYIVGNEACERFSYYGMMGILELYLARQMKLGEAEATEVLHLFGGAVYFLPLLGGWLADRWLGRYRTILIISLFYCLGHGTLALFGTRPAGLFTGLALIAFGAGGIKPCVSAFVGDQFGPNQQHLLMKVYGWFYWTINLGAAAAFLLIPWIHTRAGYAWAFGVPGIAMAVATLIFWLGTKHYVRQPPAKNNERVRFIRIAWHALTHFHRSKASGGFWETPRRNYSRREIEDSRTVLRILAIFGTIPMFWALFNQVNSTWVLQGNHLQPWLFLNGETMQGIGAILVMVWVPILTLGVYPWLERSGVQPTALRRMSAGMVLGAVAFVLCGRLQAHLDQHESLSIGWQLVPYFVLEAGEVMLSATALEFAFAQAPKPLKSLIMSLWLMTIAGGHFLIAVFTGLNEKYIHATGAKEFYFYALLMFVVAGLFIAIATRYRERVVPV